MKKEILNTIKNILIIKAVYFLGFFYFMVNHPSPELQPALKLIYGWAM